MSKMKIETGTAVVFQDHYTKKKHMWWNQGNRSESLHYDYKENFKKPPQVFVAINGIWANDKEDLRVRLELDEEHCDENHFVVHAQTWSKGQLDKVEIRFMAIGE